MTDELLLLLLMFDIFLLLIVVKYADLCCCLYMRKRACIRLAYIIFHSKLNNTVLRRNDVNKRADLVRMKPLKVVPSKSFSSLDFDICLRLTLEALSFSLSLSYLPSPSSFSSSLYS